MNRDLGTFFVVSTPLGNLKDITVRARECLSSVALVAAEDTRRTKKLLSHLGISCRLMSCNEHREQERVSEIFSVIKDGRDVAFVSDAGTPSISDPGAFLVRALREQGVPVVPVPGPSAVSCALSVCGMRASSYFFLGFLPRKSNARKRAIERVKDLDTLLVIFEAPHRLRSCLEDLVEILGNRRAFLAREMTKLHETYVDDTLEGLLQLADSKIKGEITLVIEGRASGESCVNVAEKELISLLGLLLKGEKRPAREIIETVSGVTGLNKGLVYDLCLKVKKDLKESG